MTLRVHLPTFSNISSFQDLSNYVGKYTVIITDKTGCQNIENKT